MSKVSRNHKPLSIRVLVVDDCPDGREMVTEYLTFRGFAVTVATGGADAIAQVQRVRPDIVLMDLRMPGINGWKATRALKEDPETRTIPIIAVTAHALQAELHAAKAAGCDGVICKPFDLTALGDALPRFLKIGASALQVSGLFIAAPVTGDQHGRLTAFAPPPEERTPLG